MGKKTGGSDWLQTAYSIYSTRLRSNNLDLVTEWCRDGKDLLSKVSGDRARGVKVVVLDVEGTGISSERFSKLLFEWIEEGGSRVTFVIGGAEGLPPELREGLGGGGGEGGG